MVKPFVKGSGVGKETFFASPLWFVFVAAVLWSTGGLFIKSTSLDGFE